MGSYYGTRLAWCEGRFYKGESMTRLPQPKTLFLFDSFDEKAFFFELEGDHSRFHDVYIGGGVPKGVKAKDYEKLGEDLSELVYDDGALKVKKLAKPTKDWDFFVQCGIEP